MKSLTALMRPLGPTLAAIAGVTAVSALGMVLSRIAGYSSGVHLFLILGDLALLALYLTCPSAQDMDC